MPVTVVHPDNANGTLAARSIAAKAVSVNSTVVRRFSDSRLSWKVRIANLLLTRETIGIGFSILVHSVVLSVLASLYFSQPSTREEPQIWGVAGQVDDVGSDGILDTGLPSEAGESAPLQMSDVTQSLETLGSQSEFGQTLRTGFGGKGNGDGDEGTGTSMHAAGLRIPGHAQTKGSFSAWSEPQDPKPGEEYEVVIRIRLPDKITKFRGSDISGNVIGTDRYRKTIRFRSNEFFPVENGAVEIRIQIPGAQKLVRDTIRVESRILREKQVFEIEF